MPKTLAIPHTNTPNQSRKSQNRKIRRVAVIHAKRKAIESASSPFPAESKDNSRAVGVDMDVAEAIEKAARDHRCCVRAEY